MYDDPARTPKHPAPSGSRRSGARTLLAGAACIAGTATLAAVLAVPIAGATASPAPSHGHAGAPVRLDATTSGQMAGKYRVSRVMVEKVRITERAARRAAAATRAVNAEPRISQQIAAAQAAGKTVSAAVAAEASLKTDAAAAASATGGIDLTALLALTPSATPKSSSVIATARAGLSSARSELRAVRADVRTIHHALGGTSS